jgi:hypothetical protein
MRIQTTVTDLSPRQMRYVTERVPVDGREFLSGVPRTCTVFELSEGINLHVEMDVVELASLMVTLAGIQVRQVVESGPYQNES